MSQVQVLALADDLTGALEIGAKFAGAGIQSVVTAAARLCADRPMLVIDTQTRHLGAQEAYRVVRALAESARRDNLRL
ncbi:MAG: four-carbon acid sugar kinase family protein, partial [Bryobacterales bacterium]|nr:four-carbon acid sugar kinase family protein [Bryobacterales bacterium]